MVTFGLNDVSMGTPQTWKSGKSRIGLVSLFGRLSYTIIVTVIYLREHYVPMVLLSLPVVNSGVISLQRLRRGVSLKKAS